MLFVHCGGMVIIILTLGPRLTEQELTRTSLIVAEPQVHTTNISTGEMICVTSAHIPSTKVIHMINSKLNIVENNSPPEDSQLMLINSRGLL